MVPVYSEEFRSHTYSLQAGVRVERTRPLGRGAGNRQSYTAAPKDIKSHPQFGAKSVTISKNAIPPQSLNSLSAGPLSDKPTSIPLYTRRSPLPSPHWIHMGTSVPTSTWLTGATVASPCHNHPPQHSAAGSPNPQSLVFFN